LQTSQGLQARRGVIGQAGIVARVDGIDRAGARNATVLMQETSVPISLLDSKQSLLSFPVYY
jgi:hypothetical protein